MINITLLLAVCAAVLILSAEFPFNKLIAVFVFSLFLINASPTGDDYAYYKIGFDSVSTTSDFPYVGTAELDSEPVYLWCLYLGHAVTHDFNVFLALSFVLWIFLARYAMLKLGFKCGDLRLILLCAFPAVIPVVAYWSPRSAFSLPLVVLTFYFVDRKSYLIGVPLGLLAMLLHSEYIPFVSVLIAAVVVSAWLRRSTFVSAIVVCAGIISLLRFGTALISSLPFLGEDSIFSFAAAKLHYFEDYGENVSIRPSGILMILIDLAYLLSVRRRVFLRSSEDDGQKMSAKCRDNLQRLLDIAVPFSLMVNVFFIRDAHIAGRVARFADYFIMCVGFPIVFRMVLGKKAGNVFVVTYVILALLVFQNIYMFAEG